jgi:hypothetical protein
MICRQRNLTVRGVARQSNNEQRAPKHFGREELLKKSKK